MSSGTVTTTAKTSECSIPTPKMVKYTSWEPIRSGTLSGVGRHSRPTFWRMKLIPMAVISGASFGALRSGR